MKYIYLLTVFIIYHSSLLAQNLTINWQKNLGGKNNEYAYAATPTSDGGYVIVGSTNTNKDGDIPASKGGSDILVAKLNNWGELVWLKTFGGTRDDVATDVIETKDKGILVLSTTLSTDGEGTGNGSRGGLILLKLKTDGSIEWRKVFASGYNTGEIAFAKADANSKPTIKLTPDGGFIIGASIIPVNTADFWLSKLKPTGEIQWSKTFGSAKNDWMNEVIVCSDGGFLMVGGTDGSNLEISGAGKGFIDVFVVKTDFSGKVLWQKGLGGTDLDIGFSAVETSDNAYIIVGETNSSNGDMKDNVGQKDGFLVKYTYEGELSWKVLTGGTDIDGLYTVKTTTTGKIYAMGISSSEIGKVKPKGPVGDLWLVNIENSGLITNHTMFGGADTDIARGAFPTSDGGFIIAGNSFSVDGDLTDNKGGTDFWAVKVGNQLPVQVKDFSASVTADEYVKLTWESSVEVRSKSFIIEHSIDQNQYSVIFLGSASGNSNVKKNYTYTHQKPFYGKNYYRLKFYDDVGKEYIYKTINITLSILEAEKVLEENNFSVFPNPVENPYFFIKTNAVLPKNIQLLDIIGLPISLETQSLDENQVQVSLNNTINAGIYFLLLEINNHKIVEKIVIR
ncbi:hypothetical protein EMA8858_02941 [Emticicia aquatica]|uniref:Secretion system C-terminal sorting domain-containing protein n=1 Tax=Emticicia aquatica TaxID=1681835 RepID=A0ABM9ATG1_9BACT|nr:T9SS type A sorting domain-containing protein [Emticicia aquatica]CAH0996806.1 hypothetical protein EMA8858_02941 [Emticicia aquatica]